MSEPILSGNLSRADAVKRLRFEIKNQIELSNAAKKAGVLGVRPILEKKDKSLIGALMMIEHVLSKGEQ